MCLRVLKKSVLRLLDLNVYNIDLQRFQTRLSHL
jgi:hypothetical protein